MLSSAILAAIPVALPALTRRPVLGVDLPAVSVNRVESQEITLGADAATGLHLHPCPVVGYIVEGTVRFQVEGEEARLLKPGDAFHEPANARMLHFDAEGGPAKFVAFYLLTDPHGAKIQMLDD
jgi:quercetin dioxygenase-like cupin family protein